MAPPPTTSTLEVLATYVTHLDITKEDNSHADVSTAAPLDDLNDSVPDRAVGPAITDSSSPRPANVLGWFADDPTSAYTCAPSSVAVTDRSGGVACTTSGDTALYTSRCFDQGVPLDGCGRGVSCCHGASPYCISFFWTDIATQYMYICAMSAATTYLLDSQPTSTSASTTSISSSSGHGDPTPSKTSSSDTGSSNLASTPLTSTNAETLIPGSNMTATTTTGNLTAPAAAPNDNGQGLSNASKAGIGAGTAIGSLMLLAIGFVVIKKKRRDRATNNADHQQQQQQPQEPPNASRGLQDHPEGSLPAHIAPPARHHNRTPSLGWRSTRSQSESDMGAIDLAAGASEVPVDMRGRAPGAFELDASYVSSGGGRAFELSHAARPPRQYQAYQPPPPVELEGCAPLVRMAPIGVGQDEYTAYQSQASHPRYSQAMGSVGPEAPYRGPAPVPFARPNQQYRNSDGM